MNILELFARIGLKADQGPADQFLKSVGGIKTGLIGAIAGTLSLSAAIKTVNQSFSDTLALRKFEQDTGKSSAAMQKWKAVADQVNGSGATVAETMRAITTNQEKIKLGQGNISGYQLLGIDPRADPIDVLEKFRDKTQNVSAAMRRNLASQLGISNDLVSTLELSNAQFDKMAENAWVIPGSSIESVNKARASIANLTNMITYIKTELVTKFAPVIVKGVDMIIRASKMIDIIVKGSIGWKNAIIGIAAALAIMNAGFLLSPMGLFTAGIILLMAVLEDLYVYSKGGKSLIGELVGQFPALGKVLDATFGVFKDVGTAIGAILNGDWEKLDEITKKWGVLGDAVQIVAHALDIINKGVSAESINTSMEGIKKKGFLQEYGEEGVNLFNMVKGTDWLGGNKSQTPAVAGASNTTTIIINGVPDSQAAGKVVEKVMQKQNQDTYNQGASPKKEKS